MAIIDEALAEAIEFAEQDFHALTPAGEAMVQRWRDALKARTPPAAVAGQGEPIMFKRIWNWLTEIFHPDYAEPVGFITGEGVFGSMGSAIADGDRRYKATVDAHKARLSPPAATVYDYPDNGLDCFGPPLELEKRIGR